MADNLIVEAMGSRDFPGTFTPNGDRAVYTCPKGYTYDITAGGGSHVIEATDVNVYDTRHSFSRVQEPIDPRRIADSLGEVIEHAEDMRAFNKYAVDTPLGPDSATIHDEYEATIDNYTSRIWVSGFQRDRRNPGAAEMEVALDDDGIRLTYQMTRSADGTYSAHRPGGDVLASFEAKAFLEETDRRLGAEDGYLEALLYRAATD